MAIDKPIIGQNNWGDELNAVLDDLDERLVVVEDGGTEAAPDIKTRIWGYPSEDAVAIMPAVDNESIALKSSDAAAIRWHVRNNGASGDDIVPISAAVTSGDGNYQVVFTIPEQTAVPATGPYYYQISCPENANYDAALYAQAATTTTLTFYYDTNPGTFNPSGASISQPSVYAQFEVDSDGGHIKVADWSSGPGSYSQTWDFTKEGAIHFPYGPSNGRTGSGDVLRFASSQDQAIITGPPATESIPNANRLVIAGQDGYDGENYDGEGGDIYVWAGSGGGTNGDGGDVKIDAGNGQGTGQGGYVKVRGGYSPNANGGYVNIDAGDSYTLNGGSVGITAGEAINGESTFGGSVNIAAGNSNNPGFGGSISLSTYEGGKITLSGAGGEFLNDSTVADNQIATIADIPTGASGSFVSQDGKTVTVTNGIITVIES
jgi:hypothetical protein